MTGNSLPKVQLGTRGPTVSRLGFGCMRLPMNADNKVDRELAIPMLRRAFDLGVTYFDTAVGYCNEDSQPTLGEAIEPFRERVVLSTKNPMHKETQAVWWTNLENSLRRLRTDYLDCYHFHGMRWKTFTEHIDVPGGKLELMQRARDEGLVRHICCSFHDEPDALIRLMETGLFDVITLQYNLLNRQLEEAMHRSRELGVGIVVMGPVGGGRLGVDSERVRAMTGGAAASTVEAALRFVMAHSAADVLLSGMSTMEQLEQNVAIVAGASPFTQAEIAHMEEDLRQVKEKLGVPCPACGYCMPCPQGVNIPEIFRIYNELLLYGLLPAAQRQYAKVEQDASRCTNCGVCREKCPQQIDIPAMLEKAHALCRAEG